ncbi:reverse transcriptase domain-containing protein [Rhizobium leguminosarum]|uniref:reverse transcriptase domain-containing protein n=1 Tax=Rhizobium leguminosarum TaxID=384 RepID=UPI00140FF0EB|nr:reverse transcriptase domain-containing protein [Rhizobium leguminosarum]QIO59982.1 hypothetical protein HA463_20705 [Rhizobium leguminosarum bv. trifolii]
MPTAISPRYMASMAHLKVREYAQSNAAFATEIERAGKSARDLVTRLKAASNRNKRRLLIDRFLKSPDAKLYYLFRAIVRCKLLHRFSPEHIVSEASTLDLFGSETEPVWFYEKPATTLQSARIITTFGPRRKARQNMVRKLLEAVHQPRPDQYTINGGVPKALKALVQDFDDGYFFAVERDIRRFYQQIRREGLATVLSPLPKRVVESVIWDGRSDDRTDTDDLSTAVTADGLLPLRGLPQGSACSPIAAEMVVASLLAGLEGDIRVRAYADNVVILGRTEDEVRAASEQLDRLANAHSAGSLRLKDNNGILDLRTQTFSFLGYEGSYLAVATPPRLDWQPHHVKLEAIETIIMKRDASSRELDDAIKWCKAAVHAYPLWQGRALWCAEAQCALRARLAYRFRGDMARVPHCRVIFEYWRSCPEIPRELQTLLPEAHDYEENGRQAVLDIMSPWVERIYREQHLSLTARSG